MITLLQALDTLSGDLVALDYYLESQNEKLKWAQQEDEALIEDDDDILHYLIQKRGRENLSLRRKYLLPI